MVFDDGAGDFGPLTDLRPAFELRTGALLTRERIAAALGGPMRLAVPAEMAELTREITGWSVSVLPRPRSGEAERPAGAEVWVSGRVTLAGLRAVEAAMPGLRRGRVELRAGDGSLVAGSAGVAGAEVVPEPGNQRWLLSRPWHLLDDLEASLRADLETGLYAALPARSATLGDGPVRVHPSATIQPGVVLNTTGGPIAIDEHATIGANSVLEGPCCVGPHSVVQPLTLLRPMSVIGPWCKVAGEISFSVIQGHSNKAHAGYLGHSLVGRWVNLGADTTVSNLKNTYGPVRVVLHDGAAGQDTGRTFCGPIFGDYVRTAIGTRVLTGSCLGTASMVACPGFPPKHTRAFAFLTEAGEEGQRWEKFESTAEAMQQRRGLTLSAAERDRLRALWAG